MELLLVTLIDTGNVTAELRSASAAGSTGVLSQTNIHGVKCSHELTQWNRR